ncbi:zinc finger HIT domain-containing protein 3 [Platysternon megacephalum]|uniref:Zinc finger HIT domain-containing protein 3 n=1 Tax=Platysternon megacephalum TaxID=55544 RepID=A0A4D9ESE3_9SAUR|nr:zinc finger HIT domain-containing protein 3 [Platysternon megacephalum]
MQEPGPGAYESIVSNGAELALWHSMAGHGGGLVTNSWGTGKSQSLTPALRGCQRLQAHSASGCGSYLLTIRLTEACLGQRFVFLAPEAFIYYSERWERAGDIVASLFRSRFLQLITDATE